MAAWLRREPWEVAGCANDATFDALCRTYYPHYTLGTDRLGRPVLVQKVHCTINMIGVISCARKLCVFYHRLYKLYYYSYIGTVHRARVN